MLKLVLIFTFFIYSAQSQVFRNDNFGAKLGLQIQIGTHINRIGMTFQGYYHDYFYQLNAGSCVQYTLKGNGENKNFWSTRTNLGAILLAGKKETIPHFQLDGLNHNTAYNLALGYNYLWYRNTGGTSQNSGGWSVHTKELTIYLENDLFGGQGRDRFRTGTLVLMYHTEYFAFRLGTELWTGESRGADILFDENIKSRGGYKRLDQLPFGKTSSGKLFVGIDALLPFGNIGNFSIGLDSERIRDIMQNKLIHSSPLVTDKKGKSMPQYPMLNKNGMPTFNSLDKRKDKAYFQTGYNAFISY